MKIFISYNSKNRDIVEEIVRDLEDLGQDVWYDQKLIAGQNWWDEICRHIREYDIFVPVLSADYLTSVPCKLESEYAHDLKKHLMPIAITQEFENSKVPTFIAKIQFIKYFDPYSKESYKELRKAVRNPPKSFLPLPKPLPKPPEIPLGAILINVEEQIKFPSLSWNEQHNIVDQLSEAYRKDHNKVKANELLLALKARQDVYLNVSNKIDEILGINTDNPLNLTSIFTSRRNEEIEPIYHAINRVIRENVRWRINQFIIERNLKYHKVGLDRIHIEAILQETSDINLANLNFKNLQKTNWLKSKRGLNRDWAVGEPFDGYIDGYIMDAISSVTESEILEIASDILDACKELGFDASVIHEEVDFPSKIDDIPF